MNFFLCMLITVLVSVGVYCLLQPNLTRVIIGVIVLSNAANLILFVAGGLSDRVLPIIADGKLTMDPMASDPVPQALVLTAIVIGFGVTAFFLVLCREFFRERGDDDLSAESFE